MSQTDGSWRRLAVAEGPLPPLDEEAAIRTILRKVNQHETHPYPSWGPEVVAELRKLSANPYQPLPTGLSEVVLCELCRDIQWGLTNGLALFCRVESHSEPRWMVVTQSGQLAVLRLGRRSTLVTLHSPGGSVRGDGDRGRRNAVVEYLVQHNFPPGVVPGSREYPGPTWRKNVGSPHPQVRYDFRALSPRAFGFEAGRPGEPWQRPH
jgi:hypothetical protein